jgi:hypothetical protein
VIRQWFARWCRNRRIDAVFRYVSARYGEAACTATAESAVRDAAPLSEAIADWRGAQSAGDRLYRAYILHTV